MMTRIIYFYPTIKTQKTLKKKAGAVEIETRAWLYTPQGIHKAAIRSHCTL